MLQLIRYTVVSVLLVIFTNTSSSGQIIIISGTIINSTTGKPLEDANIKIENTDIGTTSDRMGKFKIKVFQDNILIISRIGFKSARLSLENSVSDTTINLMPAPYVLDEIIVSSGKDALNNFKYSLGKEEIERLSGISKDPLLSIQSVPGVVSNDEASSVYSVRGGGPDENLIMINGNEISNPFHLKEYPVTGLSIFNPLMVKKAEFSPGGFPARYGNALSSILNIEYDPGKIDRFTCKTDFSLTDLSIMIKSPLNKKGTLAAGYRNSFIKKMLSLLSDRKSIPDISFFDMQVQIDYLVSSAAKLKVNFIYSQDNFLDNSRTDMYGVPGQELLSGNIENKFTSFSENSKYNYKGNIISGNIYLTNCISENMMIESFVSFAREIENKNYFMNKEGRAYYYNSPALYKISREHNNISCVYKSTSITLREKLILHVNRSYDLLLGSDFKNGIYFKEKYSDGLISITENLKYLHEKSEYDVPRNPKYNDTVIYKIPELKTGFLY